MQNVDIQVRRQPTKRHLKNVPRGETLLGLYEGVPLTERHDYNMTQENTRKVEEEDKPLAACPSNL